MLDPDPAAPGEARRFVTSTCEQWHRGDDLDTVALLTSELVTNGVLHARTPVAVQMCEDDRGLLVEVHDSDPRPPTPRGHRLNLLADIDEILRRLDDTLSLTTIDERHAAVAVGPAGAIGAGRGLLLVEALADEWGVELAADGKAVWFRLAQS